MRRVVLALIAWSLLPGGCVADQAHPAVEVRTQVVTKEVQKPCPVTKPARPAKLARPLPTDAVKLAALALAKLAEYAAPGGYADRADAAITECQKVGS